ncbi:MAG: T9SS type A sorting domain-containing protein [Crocinitomicaceae bacterium]|nr:T9SS type A sorting domain-containing protein [Crocinitomicaceae bacterium]
MKSNLLAALLILPLSMFAQIPNNGFETWTIVGAYQDPDSWGTMNSITDLGGVYTATKGTPGSPGSSYLKLTSQTVGPAVVNGIAVSGVLDQMSMQPESGFPYTGQPLSFTGKWQHMIYGSSQGGITVVLTHWNTTTNQRDTVAKANQTLSGMAMSWANFTIPFVYYSSVVPDSCIIFLRASGSNPTQNDYLWVDNLSFTGSVVGMSENELSNLDLQIFPNPASEFVNLTFNSLTNQNVNLEVFDMAGNAVLVKKLAVTSGQHKEVISLEGLSKGTYQVKLLTDSGILVKSFMVQ